MLEKEIKEFLLSKGVSDVGFCKAENEAPNGLGYAISIVVKLSDSIIDEIQDEPTATYFNHYRTVNFFIDQCLLQAGLFLQSRGYNYVTVAASQSMPGTPFYGRQSHKEIACKANLGHIGKNCLFLHKDFGPRVRLGTIFTDCPFEEFLEECQNPCTNCDLCVKNCPSGAISGNMPSITREDFFNPQLCSDYMKKKFHHIGRGVVCGICMQVCPAGKK